MTIRTQLAYAAAGLVLVLGLLALLNPAMAARVLGLEIVATRGLSEIRSVQGALLLTAAGLMVWAIPLRPRTAPLLRTVGILLAGAAVGRAASLVIDGVLGIGNLLMLAGYAFAAGAALWASYESRAEMRAEAERRAAERRAAERKTVEASMAAQGATDRSATPARPRAPGTTPSTGGAKGADARGPERR